MNEPYVLVLPDSVKQALRENKEPITRPDRKVLLDAALADLAKVWGGEENVPPLSGQDKEALIQKYAAIFSANQDTASPRATRTFQVSCVQGAKHHVKFMGRTYPATMHELPTVVEIQRAGNLEKCQLTNGGRVRRVLVVEGRAYQEGGLTHATQQPFKGTEARLRASGVTRREVELAQELILGYAIQMKTHREKKTSSILGLFLEEKIYAEPWMKFCKAQHITVLRDDDRFVTQTMNAAAPFASLLPKPVPLPPPPLIRADSSPQTPRAPQAPRAPTPPPPMPPLVASAPVLAAALAPIAVYISSETIKEMPQGELEGLLQDRRDKLMVSPRPQQGVIDIRRMKLVREISDLESELRSRSIV